MSDEHLHSAARELQRILTARDPTRVWTCEVQPADREHPNTVSDRDAPATAAPLHDHRQQEAA